MAALQQTPITFQSRTPPSTRISSKLQLQKPQKLSFSGGLPSLKVPELSIKIAGNSRSRGAKMADSAAVSYASALADVAKGNGTLEATSVDMENIDRIFSEQQVFEFFASPVIGVDKKREVLDEIAATTSLQPHTMNFLNILIDMKRIEMISEIVKDFEIVYNRLTDTEMAVVTSVVPLESQHLAQIAKGVQRLTGAKNVRIKTVLDPALVAGFTIRYGSTGSKLVDMSVKKQLEEIAAQLDLSDIQLV